MQISRYAIPCISRGGQGASRPARIRRGRMAILMLLAAAGLSGCAETTLVNHTAKSVFRPDSPQPVGKGGIYKVGNPYQINGRSEERSGGKECDRPWQYRRTPEP